MEPHAIVHRYEQILLGANKITLLKWSGNNFNVKFIENFSTVLKSKVDEKLLTNIPVLMKAIKLVWIRKMPEEF